MKQLIIGKDVAYPSGIDYKDITKVPDGAIAFFNLSDGSLITCSDDVKGSFAVVCGRGKDKMPLHFPEVNVATLTTTKAEYQEGTAFEATITIPTTEKGKVYTVVVSKCGTVFNERNLWTFSSLAKGEVAADVAADIVKQINANTYNSGVKAENTGGAITITGVNIGQNYTVAGAEELMGIEVTDVTEGTPEMLGKEYIKDLASRCAAGKGFNYLGEDGVEIYPGYPEVVDAEKYVLYTLRFAVPRVASKTRDEVVYQLLHIAVPENSAPITSLDDILTTWDKVNLMGCGKVDCPVASSSDADAGLSTPLKLQL